MPAVSAAPSPMSVAPPRVSVGAAAPADTSAGGPPGRARGGGGLKIGGIDVGRMDVFAGLGAAAAAVIPPLAVLGGPIGGAVVGALLSLVP